MQIISELEGYRRGPYAGAVGYALPDGTLDTCIAIRTIVLHDGVAYLQAGGGDRRRLRPGRRAPGVPEQARRAGGGDRAGGGAAVILLIDNYDSFTYNLAHLFGELGAEVMVRRNDEIDADEAEALAPGAARRLPRPRPAGGCRGDASRSSRGSPAASRRSASASATRRSWRPSAARSAGARARARQVDAGHPRRPRALRRACPSASRPGATTRSPRPRCPTCFEVSATCDDGEVMAVRHRELPDRRRAVPSRVGAHAARPRHRAQLPGGRRDPGRARRAARRPRPHARRGARGDDDDHGAARRRRRRSAASWSRCG